MLTIAHSLKIFQCQHCILQRVIATKCADCIKHYCTKNRENEKSSIKAHQTSKQMQTDPSDETSESSDNTQYGLKNFPVKFFNFMTHARNLDFQAFRRWTSQQKEKLIAFDQQYRSQRHQYLGPDLSFAHFIVHRFGAIKFIGQEEWVKQDKRGLYKLPSFYDPQYKVESIDVSGTDFMWESIENFRNLKHVKTLIVEDCKYFDDWCLDRLSILKNSLEHLKISNCPSITENGLIALHKLRNLKTLSLSNLPAISHTRLTIFLLEDILNECKIKYDESVGKVEEDAVKADSLGVNKS